MQNGQRIEGYYSGAVAVIWSPINMAWMVLWGPGPVETRSVLRVISDRSECEDYLRHDLQVSKEG